MANSIQAFQDDRGRLHLSANDAVIADIATALGRVGDEGGLTDGVARLIFERRAQIERAFADYDRLSSNILGTANGRERATKIAPIALVEQAAG